MKKGFSLILSVAMMACLMASASAEELIYGTMHIPFADFYAEEGVHGEVDAVSSATNSKWQSESLAAGSYSVAHESDPGGDILGVVYPVALSQATLDALGENDYAFTPIDSIPAAYKLVTLEGDHASFSPVQGPEHSVDATVTLTTQTVWGDYQLDIHSINNQDGTSDIGTLYGALVKTTDGAAYAMRQLENIWRDELSWSSGFRTVEPHDCPLAYEDYIDIMGKTICAVTYITETGYHTIQTDLYVPIKFDGGVTVNDAPVASGSAAVTLTNLPDDFAPVFAVSGFEASANAEAITFDDALPGSYTLTVSDESGKYAELSANFVLSTDILPVVYDAEQNLLIAADGVDPDLASAFIANINAVTIGEQTYAASGRGAVSIINVDGEVDFDAATVSGRGADAIETPLFSENGEYTLTVASTGFDQTLTFTVTVER